MSCPHPAVDLTVADVPFCPLLHTPGLALAQGKLEGPCLIQFLGLHRSHHVRGGVPEPGGAACQALIL